MLARLTTSQIDFSAIQCHPLTMTCTTQNLPSLSWYFDDLRIGSAFTYDPTVMLPENLYDANGLSIEVIGAVAKSAQSDEFNSTSVLTTNTLALSLLSVDGIQCGINSLRSQTIDLSGLNLEGKN